MDRMVAGKQILGNKLNELVAWTRMRANTSGIFRCALAGMLALVLGLVLLFAVTDRLWAAIELAYYRASVTHNAVFLEWATIREYNLSGFEILCKRATAPETAYHPIGSRIAQGGPDRGATYNFNITSGLIAGEAYCFRLREVTTDNTPGEVFDLCGYGPGVTPAPTSTVVTLTTDAVPTVIAVTAAPGLQPPPTLAPTLPPTPFPTPVGQPVSPILQPTPTPFDPALQQQGVPEQPTPDLGLSPTPVTTPATTPVTMPVTTPTTTLTTTLTVTPVTTPVTPPIGLDPSVAGIAQVPPAETPTFDPAPTMTPTETMTPEQPASPLPVDQAAAGLPGAPDAVAQIAGTEATPTPPYVVVTATPTPEAVAAMPLATFTPWPTAMPTPSFSLDSLLVPSTQNLMVGLLCLIFLSASGLGALGLVTSILYMRSQADRSRLPGPIYERRRY